MRNLPLGFMVSYDIVSLFTNVPLEETIDICVDVLYRSHLSTRRFPENTFKKLMLSDIQGVEFSFNNIM